MIDDLVTAWVDATIEYLISLFLEPLLFWLEWLVGFEYLG